jgi:2-polyprenyl-6-hydroxyphenyl methylase/3-demethylubiquinone-9 3-methyltransferase
VPPNLDVYDLGCGDGLISYVVAKKSRFVVGIDKDPTAIGFAREKSKRQKNLSFIIQDVTEIYDEDVADYVLCIDVIEHLEKPELLLDSITRLLRRDGRCLIGTPIFNPDRVMSKYHVREYLKEELDDFLSPYFMKISEAILQNDDGEYYFYEGMVR